MLQVQTICYERFVVIGLVLFLKSEVWNDFLFMILILLASSVISSHIDSNKLIFSTGIIPQKLTNKSFMIDELSTRATENWRTALFYSHNN